MLGTLLESRRRSPRRRVAMITSVIAHSVLLTVLVLTRAQGSSEETSKPIATNVVYFAPKQPQPRRDRARTTVPETPPVPRDLPFVRHDYLVLDDITPPLGPLGPIAPVFQTLGPVIAADTLAIRAGSAEEVLTAMAVDNPVEVVPGQRPPRYPLVLERAGIGGDVTAQFIVDTTGRVERASVRILHATHSEFAYTVAERLAALHFVPARARGRVVRQLVEQRFQFEVVRR